MYVQYKSSVQCNVTDAEFAMGSLHLECVVVNVTVMRVQVQQNKKFRILIPVDQTRGDDKPQCR